MRYRYTAREETQGLKQWCIARYFRRPVRPRWKLRGRTNDIYKKGIRFWMDVDNLYTRRFK